MVREQVPFEQPLYQDSDASDGMTLLEFLASQSAHSNCAACESTQGKITSGAENFANQQKVLASYPYQCIDANFEYMPQEEFKQACNPPSSVCAEGCAPVFNEAQKADLDGDGLLTEEEYIEVMSKISIYVPSPRNYNTDLFYNFCWLIIYCVCVLFEAQGRNIPMLFRSWRF